MKVGGLAIVSHPIMPAASAYLLLENNKSLNKYELSRGAAISLTIDTSARYCTGWYDISSHQNHVCDNHAQVDSSYNSCFACRKKTDFNPAFYNATQISQKQAIYNNRPHSVYVAYFGNNLAKAGIMSDSRGRERLYEQGAILYAIIGSFPNATVAHNLENRLIQKGLKNSITKKQKSTVFEKDVNIAEEKNVFTNILKKLGYENVEIVSNLDMFFFGAYPKQPIESVGNNVISGRIAGVIGRYVVLENNERYYGTWLSDTFGHMIDIGSDIILIDKKPQQTSFF